MVVLLVAGGLVLQPHESGGAIEVSGTLVLSYLALLLFISPVLAAIGVALAVAVWTALRVSRGSAKTAAITAGFGGAALSMAFLLVHSDARVIDLLVHLGLSAAIGGVAAWATLRDVARLQSLQDWLTVLRRGARPRAV